MFDKITHVEAVHVAAGKPSNKIATYALPLTAVAVSLASSVFSFWTYQNNQEGMKVVVSRDFHAEMGVEPLTFWTDSIPKESDYAFVARWNVSLVNTSLAATIPITSYRIVSLNFKGNGLLSRSDFPVMDDGIHLYDQNNNAVSLPLSLKPGQILNLVLTTPTAVVKDAVRGMPAPLTSTPLEAYRKMPGPTGSDAFGNKGQDSGDRLDAEENKPIREPCVSIAFQTGRDNEFRGHGYWYRKLEYKDAETGILHGIAHTGCTETWRSALFD